MTTAIKNLAKEFGEYYLAGFRARERGCYRVLCNYESPAHLRAWQRGWDAAAARIPASQRPRGGTSDAEAHR